MGDSFIF